MYATRSFRRIKEKLAPIPIYLSSMLCDLRRTNMKTKDRPILHKMYCPVCGCLLEALEPYDINTDDSFEYYCCECSLTITVDIEAEEE